MVYRLITLWIILLLAAAPLSARENASGQDCLGRVCFDKTTTVDEKQLPLSGIALLRYWGFRVYTAALYADTQGSTVDEILEKKHKKLVIHYHRDIKARDIARATRELIKLNPAADYEKLSARIEKVCAAYRDVKSADEYHIVHVPGKGVTIYFNGVEDLFVEGDDFAAAFLGIWLADACVDRKFQQRLLGNR